MPSIRPHDNPPAQTCKNRPCVSRHLRPHSLGNPPLFLHRQLRQRQHRSRKHVDDDLLVHAALDAAAKDGVPAYEPRKEGMHSGFLAGRGGGAKEEHCAFVENGVCGEVAGVLACGFEDEVELLTESDAAEPQFQERSGEA